MTTLEREIKKRKISYYRLSQLLKKNPKSNTAFVQGMITGKRPMSLELLKKICLLVTIESKDPLDYHKVQYEILRLQIK